MSKGAGSKTGTVQRQEKSSEDSANRPGHEQLVKALNHPLRTRCLTILAERVASPREIAEELEEDLSNVSYHVRVLDELGLIELIREESVRGAVAHFYKAAERTLLSNEQWEKMPLEVRKAFSTHNWDVLIKDATEAIEMGTFDNRADRHLTRTPLLLDSKGFARLSEAMDQLLEKILEEQAASAVRFNDSDEEPIYAVAGTALFAMPDQGSRQEPSSSD